MVPALLRSSQLWSFRKRRVAIPYEHLEIQGFRFYKEAGGEDEAGDGAKQHPNIAAMSALEDRHITSMAGNSMHAVQVSSVFLMVLACTESVAAAA